jgi:hypothetical protein
MTETKNEIQPKIGYLFYYPDLDHPTDNFRLDVFVSDVVTEQHFDVFKANFPVQNPKTGIKPLTIKHPWHGHKEAHVCAGLTILEDRKGKKEEAFTFGGQLSLDTQESQTVCRLISPAPILEVNESFPLHMLFIDEIEILLAEYRAKYLKESDFEAALCQADPRGLYLACLTEITQKFERFPKKDDQTMRFLTFLHAQQQKLRAAGLIKGLLPPKMSDIFKPVG